MEILDFEWDDDDSPLSYAMFVMGDPLPSSATTVVKKEDRIEWWTNGVLHRTDGPAVEWDELHGGKREWRTNGLLHRIDGPAVEWPDGSQEWWLNGLLHRIGGPAVEWGEKSNNHPQWWVNGEKQEGNA